MGFIDINTIPRNTRGIVYFNRYDAEAETLEVVVHRIFTSEFDALETYANTTNAESTMAGGETFEEFIEDLKKLHEMMVNPKYLKELKNFL